MFPEGDTIVLIQNYRLVEQGGFLVVVVLEDSSCPICKVMLSMRATRKRVRWNGDKEVPEKEILIIRRMICEKCGRIHHELPDCLVPFKRYRADVIEGIVDNKSAKAGQAPCPDSTAQRLRGWWAAVRPYFIHILATLTATYGVSYGEPPAFRETVRAVANSNNWIFTNQFCTCSV